MICFNVFRLCQRLCLGSNIYRLAISHWAFRLVPDFTTSPRFARRLNTVSARAATISLNAASPGGVPFACMTAPAISTVLSGPDAVRKAFCVSRDNSLWAKYRGAPIGPLGRDSIGVCARGKQLDRGVQICEICSLARYPFFQIVNVAADFA
jgi:hypothetical protein